LPQVFHAFSQGIDFWKEPSILNMPVDIMIPPNKMASISEKFEEFEMKPQILIEDVERYEILS